MQHFGNFLRFRLQVIIKEEEEMSMLSALLEKLAHVIGPARAAIRADVK
jgi:hypothetical protein